MIVRTYTKGNIHGIFGLVGPNSMLMVRNGILKEYASTFVLTYSERIHCRKQFSILS